MKKDPFSLSVHEHRDHGSSHPIGIILMIAVTFLLALLVLLLLPAMPYMYDSSVPAIFKITNIRHTSESGVLNYDSYMVVKNTGTKGYSNLNLYAMTYRNGELLSSSLATLNGYTFIPTHHYGIQTLGGPGSCGRTWDPNEMISIDFRDRTFHPGDIVTFEVYDAVTQQVISRHTYTA